MKKPLYLSLGITVIGAILLLLLAAIHINVGILASIIITLAAPMWVLVMMIEQFLPFALPANVAFYLLGALVSFPYYFGLFYLFFYNKTSHKKQLICKSFAITIFAAITIFNIGLQFLLLTANWS